MCTLVIAVMYVEDCGPQTANIPGTNHAGAPALTVDTYTTIRQGPIYSI